MSVGLEPSYFARPISTVRIYTISMSPRLCIVCEAGRQGLVMCVVYAYGAQDPQPPIGDPCFAGQDPRTPFPVGLPPQMRMALMS